MIESVGQRVSESKAMGVWEGRDDIAETFPVGQLAKSKGQKLIIGAEAASGTLGGEHLGAARKFRWIQSGSDLGKDRAGRLHPES